MHFSTHKSFRQTRIKFLSPNESDLLGARLPRDQIEDAGVSDRIAHFSDLFVSSQCSVAELDRKYHHWNVTDSGVSKWDSATSEKRILTKLQKKEPSEPDFEKSKMGAQSRWIQCYPIMRLRSEIQDSTISIRLSCVWCVLYYTKEYSRRTEQVETYEIMFLRSVSIVIVLSSRTGQKISSSKLEARSTISKAIHNFFDLPTSILYLWGWRASSMMGMIFVRFLATLIKSRPLRCENSTA